MFIDLEFFTVALFRNRDAIEKFGTFLEMSICLNQFMLRKIVINREK